MKFEAEKMEGCYILPPANKHTPNDEVMVALDVANLAKGFAAQADDKEIIVVAGALVTLMGCLYQHHKDFGALLGPTQLLQGFINQMRRDAQEARGRVDDGGIN